MNARHATRRVGRAFPACFRHWPVHPPYESVDPASAIRVVLTGTRSVATAAAPTAAAMPAFGWLLDDKQTAAVLTYIRNAWGNAAAPVTADEVSKRRGALAKRD